MPQGCVILKFIFGSWFVLSHDLSIAKRFFPVVRVVEHCDVRVILCAFSLVLRGIFIRHVHGFLIRIVLMTRLCCQGVCVHNFLLL